MSRVDDDRDAARVAERLAQAKRAEESRAKDKSGAASTFSKLVQGQKNAQQQMAGQKANTQTQESANTARSAIAKMLGESDSKQVEGSKSEGSRQDRTQTQARMGTKTFDDKVKQSSSAESDATGRVKESGEQGNMQTTSARSADQSSSASRTEGRSADAQTSNARLEDRKESSDSASSKAGAASGSARAEKGDLKTDADKGGGQQGGKDKGGEPAATASFRFNPALMAPVSVQKKNETQGSDKLRKAAAEIAQKIVERVRVGTNALGKMEFQIDLKNDVLGGMSVKVSLKNGKITAVFSGSDKNVLKMLEEQSESLKTALSARGLTLESLKTEAKV
jgi:flagellar hook-length control protein FliK